MLRCCCQNNCDAFRSRLTAGYHVTSLNVNRDSLSMSSRAQCFLVSKVLATTDKFLIQNFNRKCDNSEDDSSAVLSAPWGRSRYPSTVRVCVCPLAWKSPGKQTGTIFQPGSPGS
ncbi:hypothetical protein RRG08_002754 [Elysia crispata]|uniref:Uncharacterized protein n=1 Tax=Elysia crispata TaxID=231223 RepID=A0AAE0XU40_9GAST|nr:hypothetical protein RRG08_002754 [Elysia crispata]